MNNLFAIGNAIVESRSSQFSEFGKDDMDMNTCNSKDSGCKHLKGVKCDVKNCYYHNAETYCTAEQIAVGPQSADTSGETLCATFKPKEC